ncbi:hypothetical protein L873DRAFT_484433 [Choiromyces venosus 120613-1]|uniref:Transmembrane protein n=1 Tax=Choiromyces venosus 120613-1 TaxID=1336337 RepID=A0A3N4JXX3_9PEZI|nr:hypothetical protein L873DRAFT_484433 [Choiromyces venosus 120613-1]
MYTREVRNTDARSPPQNRLPVKCLSWFFFLFFLPFILFSLFFLRTPFGHFLSRVSIFCFSFSPPIPSLPSSSPPSLHPGLFFSFRPMFHVPDGAGG